MKRRLAEDTCVDADDLLAFLHARLDPASVRVLELHLARCPDCRALLSALATSESAIGAASAVGPRDADSLTATLPRLRVGEEVELARGARIGRYVVLERLGAGGMGVVYSAHDSELDRHVALKLLRGDAFSPALKEPLRERLRQEAQSMARLAHPHVVTVYDVGSFGEQIFISMELIDGVTLAQWLTAAPRRWPAIVAMLVQAGRGLAAAHAAGLVHRDFKPENVLIGADGRVRVSDFGLARASAGSDEAVASTAAPESVQRTLTGSLVGTPFYMAPEQYAGLTIDHRTDQFSFCVALSAAITGAHPFDGEGLEGLAEAVRHGRLRAAPRPDPMPGWVRRVLERGLAVDPQRRYPSMDALLAALARNPRRRLALLAGASAVLLALGLGGVLAYRQGTTAPALLCKGAERKWEGVWDDARRRDIERVFAATGKAGAADSFARVRDRLDAYAHDWSRMHTEACEATRVRGDQPEELLQKRMVCLDARLRDVRALVGRFAAADGALVEKAPRTLAMLGDLDSCEDVQALASQVPLPARAEQRARVLEVRGQLSEVKATRVAVGAGKGRDEARVVVEAARAVGYRPLEAEALLELELSESERANFKAASEFLEQAIWAAEAGRADELQARALIRLMVVKRLAGASADVALAIAPRVTALLERMGGNEKIEGILHVVVAQLLLATDKYPEAKVEAEAGLRLVEKHHGAYDPVLAEACDALGAIAVDEGHLEQALAYFERSLTLRMKEYGPQHPQVVTSMRHLGNVLIKAGRPLEAIAMLAQTLVLLERTVDAKHPDIPDTMFHLGLAYLNTGEVEKGTEMFRRAVAAVDVAGAETATLGDFLTEQGYALMALGKNEEGRAVLERALGIYERTEGRDNTSCAYTLRHLADVEIRMG